MWAGSSWPVCLQLWSHLVSLAEILKKQIIKMMHLIKALGPVSKNIETQHEMQMTTNQIATIYKSVKPHTLWEMAQGHFINCS